MKLETKKRLVTFAYMFLIGVFSTFGLLIAWAESMLGISLVILSIVIAVEYYIKMAEYDNKLAVEKFKGRI